MKKSNKIDWKADNILALCVLVLWSFGRIINPITHIELDSTNSIGPILNVFEITYILLHAALLIYVCILVTRFFGRHGLTISWKLLGELALYAYVLITLLLSVYFIAYEFGYLPLFLQNLLPIIAS